MTATVKSCSYVKIVNNGFPQKLLQNKSNTSSYFQQKKKKRGGGIESCVSNDCNEPKLTVQKMSICEGSFKKRLLSKKPGVLIFLAPSFLSSGIWGKSLSFSKPPFPHHLSV